MNVPIFSQSRKRPEKQGAPGPCRVDQFVVPLPDAIARFGGAVRASLCGASQAPVVIVVGGISANHLPCITPQGSNGWWAAVAGERQAIDPSCFRILGIEFAADPSGILAPSTRDQAAAISAVLDALGIERAHAIVGASYGGMAALALAQHFPSRIERLAIISAPAAPHPAATAARELQRRIVLLGIAAGRGPEGLAIARGLAMLTYRTRDEFERRFRGGASGEHADQSSEPGAYLRARGEDFISIISEGRFLSLSAAIDRHQVEPGEIKVPALLIGSVSDQLVPPSQMEELAALYAGPASFHLLPSFYGHDMFLKDAARLSELVGPFLRSNP